MTNKLIELFDLTGTHALVTGGGSGIGFHIAKTLGTVGAEVTLIDRNVEPLEAARKALIDEGITAHSLPLDITDYEDFDSKLAAHASGHPFQVVFANAGISAGPGPVNDSGNLANYDRDRWRDVIDVNLTGAMNTLSITSRHMEAQGRGRIVVTASLAGVRADPLVATPTPRPRLVSSALSAMPLLNWAPAASRSMRSPRACSRPTSARIIQQPRLSMALSPRCQRSSVPGRCRSWKVWRSSWLRSPPAISPVPFSISMVADNTWVPPR